LQASLLARLDQLAPVREVAQIGAALGRQFSHELIAAVALMPAAQLDDALAQLVGAELIYRRGTPPEAEYTFKHALLQDAAYSTLLRTRRRQLHAQIGAALENRYPEIIAAQPALLAHHYEEAGLREKAVDYWLAAGRQALGRSATPEALALLLRGLALVPGLPDGERREERELDVRCCSPCGAGLPIIGLEGRRPRRRGVIIEARRLAAYHEAGHAIARLVSGNPVRRVAIAEDGARDTYYLAHRAYPTLLVDAICCLAGPVAEAAAAGRPVAEVLAGTADLDMARAALARDPYRTGLQTALALARQLVAEHAAAIDAVAGALLYRGALDGDALAAELGREGDCC
jgi:hypothetical protein